MPACKVTTALLLLLLAPLFRAQAQESADFPVGLLLCGTGDCADWGTAAIRGATLASESINGRGGILGRKVRLIAEDTNEAMSGSAAVSAYRRLRQTGIRYFIGPSWSPGAMALAPVVSADRDVLMMTPSANARKFSETSDNLFNIRPVYDSSTRALVRLSRGRNWTRLAILGSQSEAEVVQSDIFQDETSRLGLTLVARVEALPDQADLRTEATRITSAKPDAVFIMNYSHMSTAAAELTKLGYHGARLAIAVDAHRVKAAGGSLEGLIVASAPEPAAEFQELYGSRFHEAPGLSAENGYDALMVLALAIQAAGTTVLEPVKDALLKVDYRGASGIIRFNSRRAVEMDPVLYRVADGSLSPLPE